MHTQTVTFILGLFGSLTAATLFFPQVWSSYKTKKTRDLAWFSIIIAMFNGIFWTSYGIVKNDPFIYITNTLMFIATVLLLFLKKKYH